MDPFQNVYMGLSGITPEEINFIKQATAELNENQQKYFYMVYTDKRKSPQDILIFTIVGLFGIAGIQRFMLKQDWIGTLYLLTFGLCGIGTIVDIINNRSLALEYNIKKIYESFQIAKISA